MAGLLSKGLTGGSSGSAASSPSGIYPARLHTAGLWEPPAVSAAPTNNTILASRLFACPIDVLQPVVVDRLGWWLEADALATVRYRFALAAQAADGGVGTLLSEGTEETTVSGYTGMIASTVSQTFAARQRAWLLMLTDTTVNGPCLQGATQYFDMPWQGPFRATTGQQPWGFVATVTYGAIAGLTPSWTRIYAGATRPPTPSWRIGTVL